MKKVLSFLLALLITASLIPSAFAADGNFCWTMLPNDAHYSGYSVEYAKGIGYVVCNNKFKYGVLDAKGKTVVPFTQDYLLPFNSEYLLAGRDGMWGVIDKTGKITVAYKYDDLIAHGEKYIQAYRQQGDSYSCGVIDPTGKVIIPFDYESLNGIQDNLFAVAKNRKKGVIDNTGKVIIPIEYTSYFNPVGKKYIATTDNTNGCRVFDLKGKLVFSDKNVIHIGSAFGDNLALSYKSTDNSGLSQTKLYDQNFKPLDTKGYTDISDFDGTYFMARKAADNSTRYGLIDANFNQVLPAKYVTIAKVADNVLRVTEDGAKYYHINYKGAKITGLDAFANVQPLRGNYVKTCTTTTTYGNERYGIADSTGKVIVPAKYKSIYYVGGGVYALETASKRLGFATFGAGTTVSSYVDGIVLKINSKNATSFGKPATTDVAPIIRNNSTMLPARFVAEQLGAKVEWDGKLRQVKIIPKDPYAGTIVMTIGSKEAKVGSRKETLHTAPFIEQGRTYTPVRFIVESLGYTVGWDAKTKTVTISK